MLTKLPDDNWVDLREVRVISYFGPYKEGSETHYDVGVKLSDGTWQIVKFPTEKEAHYFREDFGKKVADGG